jgi:hypothetical protein
LKAWLESGKPAEVLTLATAPTPLGKPSQPTNGHAKAPAKVDGWKLESNRLSCYVYDAQKKKSKQGAEFVAVKHNGEVNGKDVAFCFHDKLFDCLLAAKGKRAVFFIDPGNYVGIADVIDVDGVEFRDGQPYKPAKSVAGGPITEADLPF